MDRVDCPVYRPSKLDMSRSMEKFIESIEAHSAQYGICKIIPPSTWRPCADLGQDRDMFIGRTDQEFTRDTMVSGFYSGTLTPLRKQTVREFQQEAEKFTSMRRSDCQDELAGIEKAYWRGIPGHTIYGADNEGSLFDQNIKEWNPANLDSCLSRGLASDPSGHRLKGVNTPYLYYGRWKATFAWHTEDMELHSLNYLHYGAPKVWYCVSPTHKKKMDAFVASRLYAQHGQCKNFMRHKTVLIKPEELELHGIPVQRVVQHPGDFIINFPGAYHSGFNVGFNCAESTNFATSSWIQHGAEADFCRCRGDQQSVRLDMALFLAQAPDDHTRHLVRQRMLRDQAARGEPVDTISDNLQPAVVESDHDSSSLQQQEVRSKPTRKAAAQATAKRKAAARAKVKSKAVAQAAGKGKAAAQQGKVREGGALHKLAKGMKQLKQALQPSKAKHSKARLADKADSKKTAAMLKMAKRAELSPSATAKLPEPKPKSPPKSPHSTSSEPASPARARGRPKGSTNSTVAANDIPMQEVQTNTQKGDQQQTQQPSPLLLSQQQQQQQQQQQHSVPVLHQPSVSAGPDEAQLLGKRKRSTRAGAALEDELTLGEAVQAIHQKTVQVVRRWMSGGRYNKHISKHKQAALPQLPHVELARQAQRAQQPQQMITEQHQHTDQAGPIQQFQFMQQAQQAQQATEISAPSNSDQDSPAQLQQSSEWESNKRQRVHQAAAENGLTGSLSSQMARPSSATLRWHGSRSRSCRTTRRVGMAGACPSSFQDLLSR